MYTNVTVQQLPLHLTPVAGSALSRQERQRTVTGSLELPVRHLEFDVLWLVVDEERPFRRFEYRI